jgi:hypothetical protein
MFKVVDLHFDYLQDDDLSAWIPATATYDIVAIGAQAHFFNLNMMSVLDMLECETLNIKDAKMFCSYWLYRNVNTHLVHHMLIAKKTGWQL